MIIPLSGALSKTWQALKIAAIAFFSGMTAITSSALSLMESGANLIIFGKYSQVVHHLEVID